MCLKVWIVLLIACILESNNALPGTSFPPKGKELRQPKESTKDSATEASAHNKISPATVQKENGEQNDSSKDALESESYEDSDATLPNNTTHSSTNSSSSTSSESEDDSSDAADATTANGTALTETDESSESDSSDSEDATEMIETHVQTDAATLVSKILEGNWRPAESLARTTERFVATELPSALPTPATIRSEHLNKSYKLRGPAEVHMILNGGRSAKDIFTGNSMDARTLQIPILEPESGSFPPNGEVFSESECPDGICAINTSRYSGFKDDLDTTTTGQYGKDVQNSFKQSGILREAPRGWELDSYVFKKPIVATPAPPNWEVDSNLYVDDDLDPSVASSKQKKESEARPIAEPRSPDYSTFSDEQTKTSEVFSPVPVALKRYDIPDISDKVARDLCRAVKSSRIHSSEKFLWAALKTPVTNLKRSYSLIRPRFFPGCYKWRYSYCTGTPYAPLPDNCGYFSLVRIESEECGYIKPKSLTKPRSDSKDCPCIWPCIPFFDPIQECHYTETKTDATALDPQGYEKSSADTLPVTRLYLNHARAAHLCRFVYHTRTDRSFQVTHIPIPLNLNKDTSSADECVQWAWKPCGENMFLSPTISGTSCGSKSCFPYSLGDLEVVQRNDINFDKTCDVWVKIVNSDEKCTKFHEPDLVVPEVPDTKAISRFQAKIEPSGEDFNKTTIRPDNFTLDEGGNFTDYSKESIEAIEELLNASDIFIGDAIYDELNEGIGHEARKRDGAEADESWLDSGEDSALGKNKAGQPNPVKKAPTKLGKGTHRSLSSGRRRIPICKTPEGKKLPICKFMKQALGQDLYQGRPVLNRRVPTRELIQCNWFAELTICTVIPKGSENMSRRKRSAYHAHARFPAASLKDWRRTPGRLPWGKVRKAPFWDSRRKLSKRSSESEIHDQYPDIQVLDLMDGSPSLGVRDGSTVEEPLISEPELSEGNQNGGGAENINPSSNAPIILDLPTQKFESQDSPLVITDKPTEDNSGSVRIMSNSEEVILDLRKKPSEVPIAEGGEQQQQFLNRSPGLPPSDQVNQILADAMQGIGNVLPMPKLDLICEEGGECADGSAESKIEPELDYDREEMIKSPHQCGIYGCFPVNSESIGAIRRRVQDEPQVNPDNGGYVLCSYVSGVPECKFTAITTHKHSSSAA